MIQKQTDKGVSPVIGVILMVAITVIIAAVVANFVLDLGSSLQEDADATVTFDQEADYSGDEGSYILTITTTSMDNADYTYAQLSGGELNEDNVDQQLSDPDLKDEEVASDERKVSMILSGDRLVISDLSGDEDIQVFGVLDGESNQIASYSVDDPQRFN